MDDVYIVGVGMTPFGRLLDRTVYDMAGEAVALALKDAGCERGDVGSVFYASATNGLAGQTSIPGRLPCDASASKASRCSASRTLARRDRPPSIWPHRPCAPVVATSRWPWVPRR